MSSTATTLTFAVGTIHAWPGDLVFKNVNRNLTVNVASDADIALTGSDRSSTGMVKTTLASAEAGQGGLDQDDARPGVAERAPR